MQRDVQDFRLIVNLDGVSAADSAFTCDNEHEAAKQYIADGL